MTAASRPSLWEVSWVPCASPSRTTDDIEVAGFAGEPVPPLVDLATVNADRRRRLDADANAVSLNGDDGDMDVAGNDNFFAETPGQNEHGSPPGKGVQRPRHCWDIRPQPSS